ncbi:MAG: hypothetical protein IPL79_03925 [Myxococcales bacterium]|nr:hypothetical protein [Myxococcales bacterium]
MQSPRADYAPAPRARQTLTNGLIATFLGLNAWAQLLLWPMLSRAGDGWTVADVVMVAAPPLCLGLGIWRRREWLLLWAVPFCLLAPLVAMPELVSLARYPALRLLATSASLVVYILSIAWVAAGALPAGGAIVTTKLSSRPRPPRWARRERMFWGLTAVTAIMPVALLGHILYDTRFLERIVELYGERHRAMQILLGLGALLTWLGIVVWAIIGVLDRHRAGDPALLASIDALGQRATLRPGFVIAIATGVAAVTAISVLR